MSQKLCTVVILEFPHKSERVTPFNNTLVTVTTQVSVILVSYVRVRHLKHRIVILTILNVKSTNLI